MVHLSADRRPAETQLASFLAKYTPEMEARATSILSRMSQLLPGAVQMVYDNYNALAIDMVLPRRFQTRSSRLLFTLDCCLPSIAVYPRLLFTLAG
ncbi:MAG: hypothetical protein EBY17_28695 [Acidobacteriia bacterium]|nr:hypothetical protein [Terriglobia bacterium]